VYKFRYFRYAPGVSAACVLRAGSAMITCKRVFDRYPTVTRPFLHRYELKEEEEEEEEEERSFTNDLNETVKSSAVGVHRKCAPGAPGGLE
jgi:hypothetical protein